MVTNGGLLGPNDRALAIRCSSSGLTTNGASSSSATAHCDSDRVSLPMSAVVLTISASEWGSRGCSARRTAPTAYQVCVLAHTHMCAHADAHRTKVIGKKIRIQGTRHAMLTSTSVMRSSQDRRPAKRTARYLLVHVPSFWPEGLSA